MTVEQICKAAKEQSFELAILETEKERDTACDREVDPRGERRYPAGERVRSGSRRRFERVHERPPRA